jgi:hypothetical protein
LFSVRRQTCAGFKNNGFVSKEASALAHGSSAHQQSPHRRGGDDSYGFACCRYNVGTTIMFSSVDVVRPHRMTIAIGV